MGVSGVDHQLLPTWWIDCLEGAFAYQMWPRFRFPKAGEKLYCIKKQLLVKCMVNELISLFQVFELICYGIIASFMKNNWEKCSSKSNLDKGLGISIVFVSKVLNGGKSRSQERWFKHLKTIFEKSPLEGSDVGVLWFSKILKNNLNNYRAFSTNESALKNQSLSVCWLW
jgi:hypothetical protein